MTRKIDWNFDKNLIKNIRNEAASARDLRNALKRYIQREHTASKFILVSSRIEICNV